MLRNNLILLPRSLARMDWQPELGGAAVYSEGDVKFYEQANFLGNGQYEADASGYEPSNEPGGAILNAGTMEVDCCMGVQRYCMGGK